MTAYWRIELSVNQVAKNTGFGHAGRGVAGVVPYTVPQ